jgi:hypothetical protein
MSTTHTTDLFTGLELTELLCAEQNLSKHKLKFYLHRAQPFLKMQ